MGDRIVRNAGVEVMLPSIALRDNLGDPTHMHVLTDMEEARLHEMIAAGVELPQPNGGWNGFLTLLWNKEEKTWGYMAGVRSSNGELAQGMVNFGGIARCRSMNFLIPHPSDFKSEPVLEATMNEYEVAAATVDRLSDIQLVAAQWGPWFRNLAVGMERVKRNLPPACINTKDNVSVARKQFLHVIPASWVPQRAVGAIVRGMWGVGNLSMDAGGMVTIHDVPDVPEGIRQTQVVGTYSSL
ncbi:MAG: hypothetical protein WC851_02600 [Candidatus Shapirobacteria bacterium]|jgi:hypothetical protein